MNSMALARNAYSDARSVALSGRDIEYRAFVRATRALAELPVDGPDAFPALAEALHQNLALWGVIAQDVANDNNALPEQLRAQLYYLYEFTRAHSRQVLDGKAEVGALVDINRAVMRGLRPNAAQD